MSILKIVVICIVIRIVGTIIGNIIRAFTTIKITHKER